ncbi:U-box domain-containing protein 4 [Selaginella moellendorffii]|uniref:U-box domain-containing protein 4 n=1 Tax=Selaginella moellendorffii TaxID=88036 RepID=UPI000D1C9FFE|nr:U-box domain-containing protein 4 [Selaginella moellendorffii]|eukprot:XP_024518834.1 U-box domain-containing protein 4 [Selaginella moellendorffii]
MEANRGTAHARISGVLRGLIAACEHGGDTGSSTASSGRHSLSSHQLQLLVYLKSVAAVLAEGDSCAIAGERARSLENALQGAKVLLDMSGSKIYKAGGNSSYFVDVSDARLAEEIDTMLLQHRHGKAVGRNKLQSIASKVGIRCNNGLGKELEALQREGESAASEDQKAEIQDVLLLFTQLLSEIDDDDKAWGVPIPADFRCPLSLELMVDPVIVASGQTYERAYIQRWLEQGNFSCPKTRQPLPHDNLIPNYTVKALITSWCEANNVAEAAALEKNVGCARNAASGRYYRQTKSLGRASRFHSLLELDKRHNSFQDRVTRSGETSQAFEQLITNLVTDLSSPFAGARKYAAAELRLLAKDDIQSRILVVEAGAVRPLIALLDDGDEQTQEIAVTALLNLSINDNNKAEISRAGAIDPLVRVLKAGSSAAVENAAATLFNLSVVDNNKEVIGAAGAISPLVELLASGSPGGKKDAATALFNLSTSHDNKPRMVRAGAIRPLVELASQAATGMVDKAVAILANLSTVPEGRVSIAEEGGIIALVQVVETGSPRGQENAAAALLHLCINSSKHRAMVLQEGAVPPLHALSLAGTPRGKDKALALLRHFREQRVGKQQEY